MKQAFRLSGAAAFCFLLLTAAAATTFAQTVQDPFVAQITTSNRESFAGDISGDGRFVVIESTGDIATEKTAARNNADGNREIFLFDYAQRKIFQITSTTSARVNPANPFFPATNPNDFSNIRVEISSNQPSISNDGRWLVFSSNATTPGSFNGDANSAALIADGNQEIFLYAVPAAPVVDLTDGSDPAPVDLAAGTFTRVTDTPASRLPVAGTAATTNSPATSPIVAFDNRDAAIDDDGSVVAFVSTRNLVGGNNADGSPEIFLYRRSPAPATLAQLTATTPTGNQIPFSENPSLSGDGSVIAFISNANLLTGNADLNGEIFLGSFNGTNATVTRQVTNTTSPFAGIGLNFLSPGRRLSRDGNFIAFDSVVDLPGDGSIKTTPTVILYTVSANNFKAVGPRPNVSTALRYPTFTDYNPTTLAPATLIFSSALNFKADGTAPATPSEGLNPNSGMQIFATPVSNPTTFTRLTNTPTGSFLPELRPLTSNTRERIAFSLQFVELGGLNSELLSEAFYLLVKTGTNVANPTVTFFTGASERGVVATPTAPQVAGLAPGMIGNIHSTTPLAPSAQAATSASESAHRPPLPIELNGVSVSVGGAAAGLYGVSPEAIRFVVPPGLTAADSVPVVINNNGSIIRTTLRLLPTQPDLFDYTNAFGTNRAVAQNVTNPLSAGTPEPFAVTTTYVNGSGQTVTAPTIVRFSLTGVRRITDNSQITVTIGTTNIVGTTAATSPVKVAPSDLVGIDHIDVTLPATLAGAGDVPVVITVTVGGTTYTSRPAANGAPMIRIL